jgi:hypothetical protein
LPGGNAVLMMAAGQAALARRGKVFPPESPESLPVIHPSDTGLSEASTVVDQADVGRTRSLGLPPTAATNTDDDDFVFDRARPLPPSATRAAMAGLHSKVQRGIKVATRSIAALLRPPQEPSAAAPSDVTRLHPDEAGRDKTRS